MGKKMRVHSQARLPLLLVLLFLSYLAAQTPGKALQIYSLDVEGGQATLLVSPSGQSMLVDTGWPGFEGRDADRIIAAADVSRLEDPVIRELLRQDLGIHPQLAPMVAEKLQFHETNRLAPDHFEPI